MNFWPLTLRQAQNLARDYQDLVGQSFTQNDPCEHIECVAVAPYDEINKWIFVAYYTELKCPDQSIAYYTGHFYDVIVMAWSVSEGRYIYKDLKVYLNEFELLSDELY